MNNIITRISLALALFAGLAVPAAAQTALTQTTLNGAITTPSPTNPNPTTQVTLLSGTGVAVGSFLAVDQELMVVTSIANSPTFTVTRTGQGSSIVQTHLTGAIVYVIPSSSPQTLTTIDPSGSCTASQWQYLPVINVRSGTASFCIVGVAGGATGLWSAYQFAAAKDLRSGRVALAATAASNAYTIKVTDSIVALSTTGTGSGSVSPTINTWTLPSHLGVAGKKLLLKDESGGVSTTTFIAISGTIDNVVTTTLGVYLKTAYGSLALYAGSGGWFTISCYPSLKCQ